MRSERRNAPQPAEAASRANAREAALRTGRLRAAGSEEPNSELHAAADKRDLPGDSRHPPKPHPTQTSSAPKPHPIRTAPQNERTPPAIRTDPPPQNERAPRKTNGATPAKRTEPPPQNNRSLPSKQTEPPLKTNGASPQNERSLPSKQTEPLRKTNGCRPFGGRHPHSVSERSGQKIDSSVRVVSSSSAFMPITELPLPLSRGLHTATEYFCGQTAAIPPPTPLLPGNPTRKENSPASS